MKFDIQTRTFIEKEIDAEMPAIIYDGGVLSWMAFETEVEKWVLNAKSLGATPNTPIVIRGHKEAGFLVAIAGCMSIGAPFVPVDVVYPEKRYKSLVDISGANLTYLSDSGKFEKHSNNSKPIDLASDLSYLIFTSGTTGEPKGVQIGKDSVVSLVKWMSENFELGSSPVFMNQALFSFDLSIYEVMGMLGLGGCIVLNERKLIADQDLFLDRQKAAGITCWVSTPSFAYQLLLSKNFNSQHIPSLKTFLFCGEPLSKIIVKKLKERFPFSSIINTYGPTEATVATTWVFVDDDIIEKYDSLPVGYPKPDATIFIDPSNDEICIAGDHVMRGYLNNNDLNSIKLFTYEGSRAFRTGDLGKLQDGLLFCNGRIDDQIKFNGFRIELLDIDNALMRINGVRNAATVPLRKSDGVVTRLVSFVVKDELTATISEKNYRDYLSETLPSYMIPSELILMNELPTSINQKIDRKKLEQMYLAKTF